MKNLKLMNNACLLETLQKKSLDERRLTIEVIELLEEVERRSLHLERGYGSLLEFCIRELRYSESAAYRRISAMRVAKEVPQVKKAIEQGSLNLVTITQAQTFFRQEKKYQAKNYSTSEKIEVLKSLENQSKRAAEKILMERSPELPKVETRRQVSATQTQVTICLDQSLIDQLEEIKSKYSHRNPNPTYAELIALMAGEILALRSKKPNAVTRIERLKVLETAASLMEKSVSAEGALNGSSATTVVPTETRLSKETTVVPTEIRLRKETKKAKVPILTRVTREDQSVTGETCVLRTQHNAKPPEQNRSRYLPRAVKEHVFARDGGCCGYQDPKTNQKCGSKFQLEYDHVVPFSMNGSNEAQNIRLACRNHNQYYWRSRSQIRCKAIGL